VVFSSVPFLFAFLPAVLALYFLLPFKIKGKNLILLLFNLIFYAWGGLYYTVLILISTFSGWFFGLLIEKFRGTKGSKWSMIGSLVVGLGLLGVYKYADFFVGNVNGIFGSTLPLPHLLLPIGISFYTFQILSYTMDLQRGDCRVQKNPLTFAMYVMLFPQLIAGPIVRYKTVADELEYREHSWAMFSGGVTRFIVGLGKKVLVANVMAELTHKILGNERTVLSMWIYICAYALQIYFDFSGYSDMAIGMGHMFGFKFLENFEHPYTSKTVTEFWRKWHISLGTWFRDYVYIPLGGNRVKPWRHVFNIIVVWFLTGFWHGAGWNFVVWGLYFGVLLMVEKFFLANVLKKLPGFVSHIYLILIILISWVFFDSPSLTEAIVRLGQMVGAGNIPLSDAETIYALRNYLFPILIGIIGSTKLPLRLGKAMVSSPKHQGMARILETAFVAVILLAVTGYMVDGSFNPFIYFRF
jgi:alginate O-acetyltransferase complex protein AlgI